MTSPTLPFAARVVTDPDIRDSYATDASTVRGAWEVPTDFTLVRARDLADVKDVMTYAAATRTPVVPQGARTSRAAGARAISGGIVLNVEALNTISEIDPLQGIAVVGPGVVNAELKAAAASEGLFYGPDPASSASCTIGGNVATNAGGLCCLKYGVTADWVTALQVVLPGGEVMTTGHRTAKGVAGYDLTGLFVGSEGTLGVVTQVVTRVVPAPDPPLTALGIFDSLDAAVEAIRALRRDPHRPSMLEILDRASLRAIAQFGDYGYPAEAEAVLLVQADRGGHPADDVRRYGERMTAAGAIDGAVAEDPQEADLLLQGRRVVSTAFEAMGARLAEDVCVPIPRLAEFIRGVEQIAEARQVLIPAGGHGGDGNLHPSIVFDPADPDAKQRAWAAFDDVLGLGLELGGTITGEHGVGRTKAEWLARELGAAELGRQRQIKALFDPLGIMNPGVVFADSPRSS